MKKNLLLLAAATMFTISACGPSEEEKAAAEKAKQDSIAAVEKAMADSLAAVAQQQAMQDSMNAAMEKMRQDSIAMADELAKAKKGAVKPKKKKEEVKTTGVTKGGVDVGGGTKNETPPTVTKGGQPVKK